MGWPQRGEIPKLDAFCELLGCWNRAFNLVSRQDFGRLWERHVLDSLAVADWLAGDRVVDLGSGAGFPGLPLAITEPARQFSLLDSSERKVRFLRQAVIELELANVEVIHDRAEALEARFDTVLARAVAPPEEVLRWSEKLLVPGGTAVLYARAPLTCGALRLAEERAYRLPGVDGTWWASRLTAPGASS